VAANRRTHGEGCFEASLDVVRELMTNSSSTVKLTTTVQKGGCAAKVSATVLQEILDQVRFPPKHPDVQVDGGLFDDAAIVRVSDDVAMVQTLDFFTPIVDTPRVFGAVAAANALSDVYAMGGVPKTALAILAFPLATMGSEVIVDVLQGACDVMARAGVSLVGGHSIDDDTLKFGLSVTGLVHPARVWTNAGARSGDTLILTKAIGTGTLSAALKRGAKTEHDIAQALDSMMQLNDVHTPLSKAPTLAPHIHAATDITGFGLLGHAMQMAKASRTSIHLHMSRIPVLDGARASIEQQFLTKAHRSNADYVKAHCVYVGLSAVDVQLLVDPQTSGGLLLSVAHDQAQAIVDVLTPVFGHAAIIGTVGDVGDDKMTLRVEA
jgi:selenide, water dikinase